MISGTFVDRPRLAIVIAILTTLAGLLALVRIPVAQFPDIVPPQVSVQAVYPGASAAVVEATVAQIVESAVNGVENMLYMRSNSANDGTYSLSVSFALGTNPDINTVNVNNRIQANLARLPQEVQRSGLVVRKQSSSVLQFVALTSTDPAHTPLFLSNYATINIVDRLARTQGVGQANLFGEQRYSMRVWFEIDRLTSLNLTPGDLAAAIRSQNIQAAVGRLGAQPTPDTQQFQINIQTLGRLVTPEQFGEIVIRANPDGSVLRMRDVARVDLGAQSMEQQSRLNGQPAVTMGIYLSPGANALQVSKALQRALDELSTRFPEGMRAQVLYDSSTFVEETRDEVIKTLLEAFVLVVVVVYLFLGSFRATLIPTIAVPVSLVGAFVILLAAGYSINTISLLAMVLAIGIVVDDAIVVVENVERHLSEGKTPVEAARLTMDEVSGALVAIALVLAAVFIPTAFIEGISGQFYRQFAVTIAVATAISCFCSLTLSPALSALLLRGHGQEHARRQGRFAAAGRAAGRPIQWFFGVFNRAFDALSRGYGRMVRFLVGSWGPSLAMLALYAGLIGLAAWGFVRVPTGFIPNQDRGYVIVALQLPGGASLSRTDEVLRKVRDIALETPGITNVVSFAGFSGATQTISSSTGAMFPVLAPFEERLEHGQTAASITADLRQRLAAVQDAFVLVIPPPSVPGIGTGGGFAMRVQDRAGLGIPALEEAAQALIARLNATPGLVAVFTPFSAAVPQVYLEVDRTKAQMLGVPVTNVFSTLEAYLGSAYVNDFNLFGRVYRVTAQADSQYRLDREQIPRLRTRNAAGQMVPIGSFVEFRDVIGTDRMPRYNLYPAIEVNGDTLPGFSTGQAIEAVARAARETLPQGIGFEWTNLSYQQTTAGNTAIYIFPLCVLFVFLVLAAQYESWSLPVAIILIVPMCLLSAIAGIAWMGMDNNILTQIGFVVLVGLASKNAILIVEVAKQYEETHTCGPVEAVVEACRLRLRPILMTSFAFILGVVPLMTAAGAGAEMRQAIGTAVFFGMLGVTAFGLLFTPVFYVAIRRILGCKKLDEQAAARAAAAPAE